jgi:hypothetical protein
MDHRFFGDPWGLHESWGFSPGITGTKGGFFDEKTQQVMGLSIK